MSDELNNDLQNDDALAGNAGNAASAGNAGKTILVADDESHILHVVSLKLRNAGFRVVTARDGQEAFEMAQVEHPDLVITDYHMPHLSGLDLCRKLKQEPSTQDIPAIMLTARGYHLEPHDTEQSGILRMLSKPFSPRHLLATVNEVLSNAA
jgi:DNA-binding response OmpR family regulator